MKTVLRGLIAAGFAAAFVAAPAAAQMKSFGLGVHGAYFQSGKLAENGDTELDLDNRGAYGAGLEWWFGSRRVGLRFEGTHTDSPFQLEFDSSLEPDPSGSDPQTELDGFGTVDTWMANASLMIRLLSPSVDRRFAPFISLGGGFVRWDTENETVTDLRLTEVDAQVYQEAQSEGAIFGSIGTDIFFTPGVALRLEAKDYYNPSSPYLMLSTLAGDPEHHGGGHNMLWSAGLQFMFGGAPVEEPGFISVAPEPEPAPPVVVQAPPPAPTTESVAMCVVDQSGRLELVRGTRNLGNGEVYVSRNGRDVLFSSVYPVTAPVYVKGAPWYVAAQPLVVSRDKDDLGGDVDDELDDAAENLVEFLNFGATQPLPMGDVLYIGSIDGTPLYATRSDIGTLLPDLEARLQASRDLDEVLDDEDFATRFATEIETFYTVVEPGTPAAEATSASCVFQPMSSTRVVRRTRG
jgi:hypothetical protein